MSTVLDPSTSPVPEALARYEILDTVPEAAFDELTAAAARRLGVRHSSLNIVTPTRVWTKSSTHSPGRSVPHHLTFCASVAADRQTVAIDDALTVPRFADHPRVGVPGGMRFYLGAPLIAPDGMVLGALCAWDEEPRAVTEEDIATLEELAGHAMALLELRRSRIQLRNGEALLTATTAVLDLIVSGAPLSDVLDVLARSVEAALPDTVCSVLLLDGVHLHHGAAPTMPAMFRDAVEGAAIGPTVGSCGTAAYTGKTVIVSDIATDPLWDDWRDLALQIGMRACWSVPIIDSTQRVLGSFALYYRTVREPEEEDLKQMTRWVNLAEVAITRAETVAALHDAATQDALTGLSNRTEALRVLDDLTETPDTAAAVLFVDLDQFKFVNDTLGHAAGDEFLVEMAHRIAVCARPQDTVARIGGDEFLLICPDVTSEQQARAIAGEVVAALGHPMPIAGRSISLSVSVGIGLHPPVTGPASEDLIANADLAMYAAKRTGRNSIAVFDEELRLEAADRLSLEADLADALSDGDLTCAYQPIVDMRNGRMVGLEALVRWTSATRGEVPADLLVAAAEDSGQILQLGEVVLRQACAQMARWRELTPGWRTVGIGVNVSPRQLADPEFGRLVHSVLAETGVPPGQLWLEITEGTVVPDPSLAGTTIAHLREAGVRIAIDDFGTGFSSLAQLKDLPADLLKIDRSFVADITSDRAVGGIVEAIMTLADTLGMVVTAEGIETAEQQQALLDRGCLYGQGFLWSRPLAPDDLLAAVVTSPNASVAGNRLTFIPIPS
ncbi:EAL domain-containing protein [Nakamurella sp. A5-74]|uniref:EAL domain-containing protein n=1 Tax=Nakamurella sp. A5-74 TaxID=3158264 RepID=A0AAU8DR10_9ACTN